MQYSTAMTNGGMGETEPNTSGSGEGQPTTLEQRVQAFRDKARAVFPDYDPDRGDVLVYKHTRTEAGIQSAFTSRLSFIQVVGGQLVSVETTTGERQEVGTLQNGIAQHWGMHGAVGAPDGVDGEAWLGVQIADLQEQLIYPAFFHVLPPTIEAES